MPGKYNKKKINALNLPKELMPSFFKDKRIEFNGEELDLNDFMEAPEPAPIVFILDIPNKNIL